MEYSQAREYVLKMTPGKKYTLVVSSWGMGVTSVFITLEKLEATKYAQYEKAVKLVFKEKRKKLLRSMVFHNNTTLAVYDGHREVNTNWLSEPEKMGDMMVQRGKYRSFDKRYFEDAVNSQNDGLIFAYDWK